MSDEAVTHRLVSSPGHVGSACGNSKPGDTIAANPSPLTCPDCGKMEDRRSVVGRVVFGPTRPRNEKPGPFSNRINNWQPLITRMASMLRRLEWSGMTRDTRRCPACDASEKPLHDTHPGMGEHYPDCDLAILLKDLP